MVVASANTAEHGLSEPRIYQFPMVMGALLVAFFVAYWSSLKWMAGEWSGSSGVLSHGYLIAAISIYLFAKVLPKAAALPSKPAWWALPILLALTVAWLLGHVATVVAVQSIVLPAILIAAITLVFGLPIARLFAFPVLFLYFAVPAVEHLQFVFQEITIVAVHAMIRSIDIVAYVEGNLVFIPEGTFAIASGCSGLNFVVSGLSLAVLYGYLHHNNVWQTVRLALLVLFVSMLGNWIRVFTIVNIGYVFGMDNKLVGDHLWLGWVIFAILMLPVFIIASRMEPDAIETTPASSGNSGRQASSRGLSAYATAFALVGLVAGPSWAKYSAPAPVNVERVAIRLPENINGWDGPSQTSWEWQPRYVGASAQRLAEYKQGETTILAYSNIYLNQSQGAELIYYRNTISGRWQQTSNKGGDGTLDVPNAGIFETTTVTTPYGLWLIAHRNIIGGKSVIGDVKGKIHQAIASLRGRPEAGVIGFAIPCVESCEDATGRLSEFISQVGPDATIGYDFGNK